MSETTEQDPPVDDTTGLAETQPEPLRSPFAPSLQRLYCARRITDAYLDALVGLHWHGFTAGEAATIRASCPPEPTS